DDREALMFPPPSDLTPCPWGCEERVLMTITEHGRPMPLDPRPDQAGNQAAFKNGPGTWRSRSLDGRDARPPEHLESRFKPHVATCPRRTAQQPLAGLPGRSRTRR